MSGRAGSSLLAVLLTTLLSVPVAGARSLPAHVQAVIAPLDSLWIGQRRQEALAAVDTAVARARAEADSLLLGQLLWRQGNFLVATGGHRRARPLLLEAVSLATALRDTLALCPALRWLALTDPGPGGPAGTRKVLDRLIDAARASGDRRHEGWGHVGLGYQAWRQGDTDKALEEYAAAADLFALAEDMEGILWSHNGLAMVRSNRGEYEQSLASYRVNAERAAAAGLPAAQGMALNNMGSLEYALGRPGRAFADFQQAVGIFRRLGRMQALPTPLLNMGLCLSVMGRSDEAEEVFTEAVKISDQVGLMELELQSLAMLAEFYSLQGKRDQAEAQYRAILAVGAQADVRFRADAHYGLANMLERERKFQPALRHLTTADSLLTEGRDLYRLLKIRGQRAQILREMDRPRAAIPGFRAVCSRARQAGIQSFVTQGYAQLGHCFLDLAAPDSALVYFTQAADAWEAERKLMLSPRWREQRAGWARKIYAELVELLLTAERPAEAWSRLQSYKGRTLLERMLGPGRVFEDVMAGSGPTRVPLEDMQRRVLQPGELFLDYALGEPNSVVMAVTRDTLVSWVLPSAGQLEPSLRAFHDLLADPDAGSAAALSSVGRAMAVMILGPLRALIQASDRILVSPDGALNLIPFSDDLFGLEGTRARWSRVPAAGVLAVLRARVLEAAGSQPWSLAVLTGNHEALPGTKGEAEDLLRRYHPAFPLKADRLVTGEMADGLPEAKILHIAAHARNDDQSPWQSAIVLETGGMQESWRASDIAQMKLGVRLAVLSSCSTAAGRVLSGEGVVGLTAAFFSAGVPTVVSSLWPVDDAVTRDFMARFYEALATGSDVTGACRRAQTAIRDNPATAQPCYWAGFVVSGEGDLRPQLAKRRSWWGLGLTALVLLMIMVGLGLRGRGRAGK